MPMRQRTGSAGLLQKLDTDSSSALYRLKPNLKMLLLPALVTVLLTGVEACHPFALDPFEKPEEQTDASALAGIGTPPVVRSIAATRSETLGWYLTFAFNRPMNTESLKGNLYIVPVPGFDGATFSLGTPVRPSETFGYAWDVSQTAVTVLFSEINENLVWRPVVDANAQDLVGQKLDGTATVPKVSAHNLARSSEDGFASSISHIGLPFYPSGPENLGGHLRYRLNFDRSTIELNLVDQNGTSITGTSLDGDRLLVTESPQFLQLRLIGKNGRVASQEYNEPEVPHLFSVGAITTVSLEDANGVDIPVIASWDLDGFLTAGSSARITAVSANEFMGLAPLAGHKAKIPGKYAFFTGSIEPPSAVYSYWKPTTGGILFDRYPVTGVAIGAFNTTLIKDGSKSWQRNEWILMTNEISGIPFKINGNNAASMTLDQIPNCLGGCSYKIRFRPDIRFSNQSAIYFTGDTIQLTIPDADNHPLPWTIEIDGTPGSGMRDCFGVPSWDGIRDGDEETGRPDDTLRWHIGLDQ